MVRQPIARLKHNPPLGRMPVLQFVMPTELNIDPAYQRDLAGGGSQSLIRKIAQHWNWDLCQPLMVARRIDQGDALYVIDGQHRLEAAKQRGDIAQLPCFIVSHASVAEEAASFVHLNQERQRLTALDIFKAAKESGDPTACAIADAMAGAGLSFAPHSNPKRWRPGMVNNIAGIRSAWQKHGADASSLALMVLGAAYPGQVLRYGGTIFTGVVAICADELAKDAALTASSELVTMMIEMVGEVDQARWRSDVALLRAAEPGLGFAEAPARVFRDAWAELLAEFLDEAA
jgi:hypothetical protein